MNPKYLSFARCACLIVLFALGSFFMIAAFETYTLLFMPLFALIALVCYLAMALAYMTWIHTDSLISKYHKYIMRNENFR